jgi:hypothetical protein
MRTVIEVLRTLHAEYQVEPRGLGRHQDYTPTKVDPQPPFDVVELRTYL